MVRTRAGNDRGKLPAEEVSGTAARASGKQPEAVAEAVATGGSNNVEKCINCEYYDRRRARPTDGKAPMWGQCRRHSPHLNPATAKAYVVEGVWPLVRDDDWCGEYKILTRMIEELLPEAAALAPEDAPSSPSRSRMMPASAGAAETAVAGDD
ncbi:MAG TPA: hypothetical protein VGK75_09925 [Casimicrobiaceae bacterium]